MEINNMSKASEGGRFLPPPLKKGKLPSMWGRRRIIIWGKEEEKEEEEEEEKV